MILRLVVSTLLVSAPASAVVLADGEAARGASEAVAPLPRLAPSAISLSAAPSLSAPISALPLSAAPSAPAPGAPSAAAAPDPKAAEILSKLTATDRYSMDDARRDYGDEAVRRAIASIRMARLTGYVYERTFGPAWQKPKIEALLSAAAGTIGIPGYDLDRACAAFQKFVDADDLKGTPGQFAQTTARRQMTLGEAAVIILGLGQKSGPAADRPWVKPSPYSPYTELLTAHAARKDLLLSLIPQGMPVRIIGSGFESPMLGYEPNMYFSWARDWLRLSRFVPRRGPDGKTVHVPQQIEYVFPFSPDGRPLHQDPPQAAPNGPAPEIRKFAGMLRGGNSVWTAGTLDQPGYFITSEHTLQYSGMTHEGVRDFVNRESAVNPDMAAKAHRASGETWARQFEAYLGIGPEGLVRSREQVVAAVADAAQVPVDHVVVAPWMPGSQTGDVDEYAADLGGNAVAVAQLMPEDVESRGLEHERDYARRLGTWLDDRARDFAARGLTVERVPMFAPVNLKPNEYGGWNPDFLATVGWGVANLFYRIPDYSAYLISHGHAAERVRRLQDYIEQRTGEVLKRYGITYSFKDASALVGSGGSLHCLTGVSCEVAPK